MSANPAPGPRPTLAVIARSAGVSVATVSKVVNGRDDVAPATRARVEKLLAERGYRPTPRSAVDRAPVTLIFSALDSPWAIEIIRGVVAAGPDIVVASMADLPDPHGWAVGVVRARRSGVIVVDSEFTQAQRATLDRAGIPYVVIDPMDLPGPDVPSVGVTNWAGGLDATRHLVELGHRRIAVLGGPERMLCSRARIDGYRFALEDAGIAADPALIRHGDFHHASGYEAARDLFALAEPPTALFACNDEQALGAIEAARGAGLSVPGDVSVIGFDDLPVARWSSPPLTTIHQPLSQMGRLAATMLATLIEGREPDHHRVELATRLVVRSSTAPAANRAA